MGGLRMDWSVFIKKHQTLMALGSNSSTPLTPSSG